MSASKAPAYFGLLVAVASGVLISGANRATRSDAATSPEIVSAPAAATKQREVSAAKPVIWKSQTLSMGSLRLRATLPVLPGNAKCIRPGPGEDEVGICEPSDAGADDPHWQVRMVTQRDRFVPATWFEEEIQSLRTLPADVLVRQLGNEANRVTSAAFTTAELVPQADTPGAIAIHGTASGPPAFASSGQQSCLYAYMLVANRPATLLYCTENIKGTVAGATTIISSLMKANPSLEYKRAGAQAAEHSRYLRRLKAAGGAAGSPELVASERVYEQATQSECQKYPPISQERFQCFEAFAANRLPVL
ncbi:hypothetical protein [Burkholderia ambifaria]|uniref:hypothetical protein n=1 Tax=Burkholderia ambifaria TaxID=152480 RepID=UPI00158DBAC3|nr:hypothetical protein [Burkholderia ambifaria]UEP20258.1 hypothetical protein LL999_09740 [Burkholderia ambifaria]WDR90986.1 hypothetical protein OR986_19555 [Burkholderia ambifaria]WDS03892.1 hypothetical protein OR985_24555 [Burkholderia ambifaria]